MPLSSLFLSKRERRLWLCALAVVVAIYATLGLAPALAEELRERGLTEGAFALGMLLVGAAIVANGLNARPRGRGIEIAVIVGIAAAYLLMFTRMALPEERTHLIEYGVVSLLIYEALSERAGVGGRISGWALPALAASSAAALGLLDEGIQALLPNRVFDWRDVLFNALAGAMASGSIAALAWARRRRA